MNNLTLLKKAVTGFGLLSPILGVPFAVAAPLVESFVSSAMEKPLSTSEMLGTQPMSNPLKAPDTSAVIPDTTDPGYIPGVSNHAADGLRRAYGDFGIPYTTTRVQEGYTSASGTTPANRLSTTYPYSAIGKLTFKVGVYNSYCSASVIRRSVIVTAAHCIQRFGAGNNTYTNFQFWPGHYGAVGATTAQIAPYGAWSALGFVRPASWANGTDTGSGSARNNDLAVIVLRKNANGRFIGDIVGQLDYGWNNYSFISSPKTGNLRTAAVSTLGYPGLMDRGRIMQRADGPVYTTTVSNAKQLWQGNNFTGGSSGGPWVVNFSTQNAVLSGGAIPGAQSTMAIIGVTSWGTADPNDDKDNYSSQFGQNREYPNASYGDYGGGNIGSLLNTLCSAVAPEGGTLENQHYCDE